ncbi:hypothetical protein [Azospirillum rugosum]|uniref:BMFP domain-containing protein YqiC n=1 Tax=Azospirillum rugosum TaxID=416170 RepID=A0ABS4SDS7_9PROT|nr:hypothetical protein [Azospirillum rugosum]MBP2290721.1 BMFP domain-containing protein YqiC [Azospirillum rugosum]MDQ0525610.1 BMFP domain-containing protein YqiC [Azospirillum rugosum]
MSQKLMVIARNPGHYADRHRKPGERFELSSAKELAASWMEPVGWSPEVSGDKAAQPAPVTVPEEVHKAALARIDDLEQALTIVKEERDAADEAAAQARARVAELEARLSAAVAPKAEEKPPAAPVQQPKPATKTDKT